MKIKQLFLVLSFLAVSVIALLYGISPLWFARTFLDVPQLSVDFAHILRAVMTLYLSLGLFWLFAAFNQKYRNSAVLTTAIFPGGLVLGRILSLLVDGQPSTILLVYTALELALIPVALLVFRLRD
ncbi:MAG: DUF4345 domain-containing protein [Planctomycetota bacterium]|nr:MAG: DUF4345 domain-containing protein [Planctomycetota bacterium]